jgi:hypothetical protein
MWDEKDDDISKIVRGMVPPIGATSVYRPDEQGYLNKDLTNPAGTSPAPQTAVDLTAPNAAQQRLEQFESQPSTRINIPQYNNNGPSAVPGVSAASNIEKPKYGIPGDMMDYFDNVVKTLTGPSQEVERLRTISQGYGLMGMSQKDAAIARVSATKSLGDIEGMRRSAAAHLAQTLSGLMTDPSKFAANIYGKELEYDIGRRGADVASRRAAVEEMKAPWEARKLSMAGPETAMGINEQGEKVTMGWNPNENKWDILTKGAVPLGVREGETFINPVTKEVIAQGSEKTRLKETFIKSYADALQQLERDTLLNMNLGSPNEKVRQQAIERKRLAQEGIRDRLLESLKSIGYTNPGEAVGIGPNAPTQARPSWEQFMAANAPKYPQATQDQLRYEYDKIYGGR